MSDIDDYARMQRDFYNARATNERTAHGLVHPDYDLASAQAPGFIRFLLHCLSGVRPPYRTSMRNNFALALIARASKMRFWLLRDAVLRVLRVVFLLLPGRRLDALDFGCGVGRLMRPFAVMGARVDGVDVSSKMLDFARADPFLARSRFFESAGADCGEAPSASYDLVYSALCMQHIASRTIRRRILQDMRRVLREGGLVVIQFHHYEGLPDSEVPAPHVPWNTDAFDAKGTNSEADVWVTPQSVPALIADVREHFQDVTIQFCEFPGEAQLFTGAYGRRFEHVFVTATAGYTRAEALYGL